MVCIVIVHGLQRGSIIFRTARRNDIYRIMNAGFRSKNLAKFRLFFLRNFGNIESEAYQRVGHQYSRTACVCDYCYISSLWSRLIDKKASDFKQAFHRIDLDDSELLEEGGIGGVLVG